MSWFLPRLPITDWGAQTSPVTTKSVIHTQEVTMVAPTILPTIHTMTPATRFVTSHKVRLSLHTVHYAHFQKFLLRDFFHPDKIVNFRT